MTFLLLQKAVKFINFPNSTPQNYNHLSVTYAICSHHNVHNLGGPNKEVQIPKEHVKRENRQFQMSASYSNLLATQQ